MAESRERKAAKDAALRDIDSYNDTVTGLICFGHAVTWDDKKRCVKPNGCIAFGRRMNTSPANRFLPNDEVTPDLVVCADGAAVIGEAKVSFHGMLEKKEKELQQLMKYDDDLTGWRTADGKVASHDVVLLVHYSRKGDTTDILEEAVKQKKLSFDRNFAAVSFTRMSQASESMTLEHFYGSLSDTKLAKRMRPLPMPLEKILPLHPERLYDAPPPPALLLQLSWDYVFSNLIAPEEFLGSGKKVFEIECTIDQIRDKLSETCGPPPLDNRNPPIPKREWVVKMFEQLVAMKKAKCLDNTAGKFVVYYTRKQMALDYFIERLLSLEAKAKRKGSAKPKRMPKIRLGRRRRRGGDLPGEWTLFGGS